MWCFYILSAVLSLTVNTAAASHHGHAPPASPGAFSHSPRSDALAGDGGHMVRRQGQIVLQTCPETLGNPMQRCSACGGDSKKAGTCDKILISGDQRNCGEIGCGVYCKCIPDSDTAISSAASSAVAAPTTTGDSPTTSAPAPTSTTTQLISVVDGSTVTGAFEATTLSEWKDLRSHTIVTTATTEADGHETEIAVAIFAGGIAWWWMSGQTAAAALALKPPIESPNDEAKDDESCDPEPKCSDDNCGGASDLGLCKAGEKSGCPCEEEKCPEQRLMCNDEKCAGDDDGLVCKKDPLEDCQCCPSDPLECAACDAKDDKCQSDDLKGCACTYWATATVHGDILPIVDEASVSNVAEAVFKDVYGGDQKRLTPDSNDGPEQETAAQPVCSHPSGASAAMDPESIKSLAKKFCASDLSKNQEADLSGTDLEPAKPELKSIIHFNYEHIDGDCALSCVDSYDKMMQTCQYNSHSFLGIATLGDKCGNYTVEARPGTSDNNGGGDSNNNDNQGEPKPSDPAYRPGTCFAYVTQVKADQKGIEVSRIRDGAGKYLPKNDDGGAFRQTSPEDIISITSSLPFILQAWQRSGNEGLEFRYGDQVWNTDKDYQKDSITPHIVMGKWEDPFEFRFRGSLVRNIRLYWNC